MEHTSLGFGYVWIQYLIDFGENKIQGSQACRILLGSMVGIYWIYALFGGSLLFGQKRMQPEHATNKKKNYGLWLPDYTILLLQSLKYIFKNLVWICLDSILIDFGENKIQGSQACRILLGSMVGIYWIYALFGGHYCLGRKGCSQNTPQKKKNYGLWLPDYTILLLQSLKYIFTNWVWICLDWIFDRFCWDFRWFHKHRCWPGTF